MKLEEALRIEREDFEKRLEIRLKKGHDYATDDILSNFKRVAEICKVLNVDVKKPEGVAIHFMVHKLLRLCNVLDKGQVMNETIEDTLLDMNNYVDLLKEILMEKKGGK